MRKIERRISDVRIEVVTTTFVASGCPEGIGDLARCVELLNAGDAAGHILLIDPAVRPLYRATDQLHLDAPLLVRRGEIVFANFEGPSASPADGVDAPALLLAPPFQIQGAVAFPAGADPAQALRNAVAGFFVVRKASVFDADGAALGEGEQIIVNGPAVQMSAITRQHIALATAPRAIESAPIQDVAAPAPASERAA